MPGHSGSSGSGILGLQVPEAMGPAPPGGAAVAAAKDSVLRAAGASAGVGTATGSRSLSTAGLLPRAGIALRGFFKGRLSRKYFVPAAVPCLAASLGALIFWRDQPLLAGVVVAAGKGGLILLSIPRLHDLDRTGWWAVIALVSPLEFILGLWLCRRLGVPDANRFGRVPRGSPPPPEKPRNPSDEPTWEELGHRQPSRSGSQLGLVLMAALMAWLGIRVISRRRAVDAPAVPVSPETATAPAPGGSPAVSSTAAPPVQRPPRPAPLTPAQQGLRYWRGDGVHRDVQKARRLFMQAAREGDPTGFFGMGQLYAGGSPRSTDLVECYMWNQMALTAARAQGREELAVSASDALRQVEGFLTRDQIEQASLRARTKTAEFR